MAMRPRAKRYFLMRGLARVIRLVVVIYLVLLFSLSVFQTQLMFPGAGTQGQPSAQFTAIDGTELLWLEARTGERAAALFGPAQSSCGEPDHAAAERPTVICFYGNGNCLKTAMPVFDRFRRLGLNVLVPEYLGYGMSGGHPSEQGCRATALAAYDYLVVTRRIDPRRIISAGWSLGGAVAIDLASRRRVGGLITFSSFTRAVEVARGWLPFVPVSFFLRPRFDSLQKIAATRCPVLIGHGMRDTVIPVAMGKQLAAAAAGPVTTVWVPEATHEHFFDVGGQQIDRAISAFIRQHFDDR